jgi:hypothetical protein
MATIFSPNGNISLPQYRITPRTKRCFASMAKAFNPLKSSVVLGAQSSQRFGFDRIGENFAQASRPQIQAVEMAGFETGSSSQ